MRDLRSEEHGGRAVGYTRNPEPKGERVYWTQTPVWKRLLCAECDRRLGALDDYAQRWGRPMMAAEAVPTGLRAYPVEYARFKLWHLSLLWRCGFPPYEGFGGIDLGPFREEIRGRLLTADAGPRERFPVLGWRLVHHETRHPYPRWASYPVKARIDGRVAYTYQVWCIEWHLFVPELPSDNRGQASLREAGEFVMDAVAFHERAHLVEAANHMKRVGERRGFST
jgi:hypothetical protein